MQFLLHNKGPHAYYQPARVGHDDDEVVAGTGEELVVAGVPGGAGDVADGGEDAEDGEEGGVVGALEGAEAVAGWELGGDGDGD